MDPITVHHVSVNVSDAGRSVAFYTDILGGTVRTDRPDFGFGGAWIDFGPAQVHLIEAETPSNVGQHFAILVGDIDVVVGELRHKGVEIGEPTPVGANRQAFLSDPDGNLIEIHQLGRAEAGATPSSS